jgi:SAM-dependent methyltransferase
VASSLGVGAGLSFSPAADRNKAAILELLEGLLPARASVLEIASGSGQHAAHCAAAQRLWSWQPTDADASSLPSIAARTSALANVRTPLQIDVLAEPWPHLPGPFDAVYCANLLHISAWPTCRALMRGAARHLVRGGVLVLYGPYVVEGEALAPSNAAFDADLRRRNPAWGLRSLAQVVDEAQRAGLALEHRWAMAANNLMLAFRSNADGD